MNHKRKRARNSRAGCKLCKFWKVNGFATGRAEGEKFSDHQKRTHAGEQVHSSEATPVKVGPHLHYDLDHLAGTWSAEEARRFADRIKAFEAMDGNLWRSGDTG